MCGGDCRYTRYYFLNVSVNNLDYSLVLASGMLAKRRWGSCDLAPELWKPVKDKNKMVERISPY